MSRDSITEIKCPICGKSFIPAPMHGWKYTRRSKNNYRDVLVCSYHCMRAAERNGIDHRRKCTAV